VKETVEQLAAGDQKDRLKAVMRAMENQQLTVGVRSLKTASGTKQIMVTT
jgi:hypothetical protein